jgi:hypothetical protein
MPNPTLTVVEELIIDEMGSTLLETTSEIENFIFDTALFLEASYPRAAELSKKLLYYY